MKQADRARKLIDIGSTTALSAMVEIVESKRERGNAPGVLARQARAMMERLEIPEDRDVAIEAFCDELQSFFESVPGIPSPRYAPEPARRRRAA